MSSLLRAAFIAVFLGLPAAPAPRALAAGALAVGACGHFGYVVKYNTPPDAAAAALAFCKQNGDQTCEVKVQVEGNCLSFAVDRSNPCGARGWGYAESQDDATSLAISVCVKYGGDHCESRIAACDSR
jgi:hypothetical protein